MLVVGGFALRAYIGGEGMVHVMFPQDDIGTLRVDGREVTPWDRRSRVRTYSVAQGTHQVSVESAQGHSASYSVKIEDGFAYQVIPFDAEQCFVLIDVAKSHYGSGKGASVLVKRYPEHHPIEVEGGAYFGVEGLPGSNQAFSSADMVQDVPCELLKESDAAILKAVGE